jgi:hypothetical protein
MSRSCATGGESTPAPPSAEELADPAGHKIWAMDTTGIAVAAAVIGALATVAYLVIGVFVVRYLKRIAEKR